MIRLLAMYLSGVTALQLIEKSALHLHINRGVIGLLNNSVKEVGAYILQI